MSGAGIAADTSGNLYLASGNGSFDTSYPALDLGNSIMKLSYGSGAFKVLDYFTPYNQSNLNGNDTDLGSGGVLLLPDQPGSHTHEMVVVGKEGKIYLINRDLLTTNNPHYCSGCSSDPQIVQESPSGEIGGMYAMPAYWNNSVYFLGAGSPLTAIPLSNGILDYAHISTGPNRFSFPGATPTISSNGTSNGIVWAINSSQFGSPGPGPGPAVLYAYDASSVSTELYNSSQATNNRDKAGNAVKFSVPTVVNGKVYIGATNEVDVYGLLSGTTTGTTTSAATPVINPGSETSVTAILVTISDATSGASIYYTTDGSTPTTSSAKYSAAFTASSSTVVKAIAGASGYTNSGVASSGYTIGSSLVSYPTGFSGVTSLAFNGGASISGSRLRLTDGGPYETRSVFSNSTVDITQFVTDFSFQLTNPDADGITFTIQGKGPTSVGTAGGALGYGGIGKSVAVKFDLYDNAGEGNNSTGWYTNGTLPTILATDLTSSNVYLHSGDVFKVHMSYNGATLAWSITDSTTGKTFSTSAAVNIANFVGSNSAFIGFTGGTGGLGATQDVLTWTYSNTPTTSTAKALVQYDTESSTVFNASKSSGPTYRVFAWPGFTHGNGTTLDATATGQSVSITLNVPVAGVYDVKIGTKAYASRGIVQLTVNGINVGPAEDLYSASEVWRLFDLGTVSLPAGNVAFVFTSVGRNASSSGFTQAFDYIKLAQQ